MFIQNNYSTANINFQAKFLDTESLQQVVEHAVQKKKFPRLNQARKDIDSAFLQVRLALDIISTENNKTIIRFSKYTPKRGLGIAYTAEDYSFVKYTDYVCPKNKKPLDFAIDRIIKLSNSAPHNKMYKQVVCLNK